MKPERLLIVSKRFWPFSGELETLVEAFAQQVVRTGCEVEVVTSRLTKQWPEHFRVHDYMVYRLPQNFKKTWSPYSLGTYVKNRWQRGLQHWLATHRQQYDAAIVLEVPEDQFTASVLLDKYQMPTITRIGWDFAKDLSKPLNRELVNISNRTTRLVTPDLGANQQWMFDPVWKEGRITCIPDGFSMPDLPSPQRKQARDILARAHPIFQLKQDSVLAVCGTEHTFDSGVFALLRAWRRVVAAHPSARLWLIGHGPNSPELFRQVCDLDMQHSVLMVGGFDEVSDVVSAADAYILPGVNESPGWFAKTAASLGLTIIHHKNSEVSRVMQPSNNIPFDDDSRMLDLVVSRWATSVSDQRKLSEPVSKSPVRPTPSTNIGASMQQMVDGYLEQLNQLVLT